MLEFRDNIQLAIDHAEKSNIDECDDIEKWRKEYNDLLEGLKMTEKTFEKSLERFKIKNN